VRLPSRLSRCLSSGVKVADISTLMQDSWGFTSILTAYSFWE
jgi:hypothetical protein